MNDFVYHKGLTYGLNFGAYKHINALNASGLNRFIKSPSFYISDGYEDNDTLELGRLIHMGVLETPQFYESYFPYPDEIKLNTKVGKEYLEYARVQNHGREPLKQSIFNTIESVNLKLQSSPYTKKLLDPKDVENEITMVWDCPETGVTCKGRIDSYNRPLRILIDLKTTTDSGDLWPRSAVKWGYFRQAVFYTWGAKMLELPVDEFVFIVVEKTEPFLTNIYRMSEATYEIVLKEIKYYIKEFKKCQDRALWPEPEVRIEDLNVPDWYFQDIKRRTSL